MGACLRAARAIISRQHRKIVDRSIQLHCSSAECLQSHRSEWLTWGDASMCKLCNQGMLRNHFGSRRNFLKGAAATGVAAAGLNLFAPRPASADQGGGDPPQDSGRPFRRYVIRGGSVMSMDYPNVGDFAQADVLVEGNTILAVGPHIAAGTADVIDATGRIVMPGFIDTHHHQFETALRSYLADGVLINDGSGTPSGSTTYYEYILNKFAPVYRPQDVYINELFGGLSQLGDGVPGNQYPQDAPRILKQWFSPGNLSRNGLVHMIMGGEVYLGNATTDKSWTIGRQLGLQIAAHILSPFGIRPILDSLAAGTGGNGHIGIGPDNLFIHMTGMSDMGWQAVKDKGAQVSIAFPIEMNMRHGMPPILKAQSLGMEPSLSVDVECTLTADFFTQMCSCMNLQRALVNQMILDQNTPPDTLELAASNNWGIPPSAASVAWPK